MEREKPLRLSEYARTDEQQKASDKNIGQKRRRYIFKK
jgi:hypothetical protein